MLFLSFICVSNLLGHEGMLFPPLSVYIDDIDDAEVRFLSAEMTYLKSGNFNNYISE